MFHHSLLSVRLGEYNIRRLDWTEQLKLSSKVIYHPSYNPRTKDNDLMLIKLLNPACLNKNVQTLELTTSCPVTNTECEVSGWGTTISPGGEVQVWLGRGTILTVKGLESARSTILWPTNGPSGPVSISVAPQRPSGQLPSNSGQVVHRAGWKEPRNLGLSSFHWSGHVFW